MTINEFFQILFIIVLFCVGWKTITDTPGQLFHFVKRFFEDFNVVREYMEEGEQMDNRADYDPGMHLFYMEYRVLKYPTWLSKPIVLCITCFASVYGIIIYALISYLTGITYNLIWQILLCVCAAGLNGIVWSIVKLIRNKTYG